MPRKLIPRSDERYSEGLCVRCSLQCGLRKPRTENNSEEHSYSTATATTLSAATGKPCLQRNFSDMGNCSACNNKIKKKT